MVPAYDEEANLPRLLADLESRPELWAGGRVIVVDDGSSDATADVAEAHGGTAAGRGPAARAPTRDRDARSTAAFGRALEIARPTTG